jgi:uncharacterized protein (TIGR02284 family)
MAESTVSGLLKALIATCEDAECGFRACASNADRMDLQLMMTQRAATWRRWAGELRALPDSDARPDSGLQRSMLVDAALAGHGDMTLLARCERIEEAAVRRYRDTLEQDLPRVVCAVVQRQVECIQRSRACMRQLRASREHAAA